MPSGRGMITAIGVATVAALVSTGCNTVCGSGARCGDGMLDLWFEQCDCGTDPRGLPAGCSGVNGSPGGECTADCSLRCGDAIVEADEACDCGLDDDDVPQGCLSVNGAPTSGCNLDCTRNPVCGDGIIDADRGEQCDPPDGAMCGADCLDIRPTEPAFVPEAE